MVNFMVDQAEGLRRILAASRTRTVAVASDDASDGPTDEGLGLYERDSKLARDITLWIVAVKLVVGL